MKFIGIVDDNPTALAQMRLLLQRARFQDVRTYTDPRQALSAFTGAPPAVLLLDFMMPGIDGVQLLSSLREAGALHGTSVAMVSGCADSATVRLSAFQAGALDVIAKPILPEEFVLQVRNLARLAGTPTMGRATAGFQALAVPRRVEAKAPKAGDPPPDHDVLKAMAALRGEGSGRHAERVAHYAAAIAHRLGMSPAQQAQLIAAAPLHDIGNIGVPDRVLFKRSALTDSERGDLERHTVIGHQLLRKSASPLLQLGAEIALSHHERWDGAGYPLGLSGEAIPLSGRIVALADAFDQLTTSPFKSAGLIDGAAEILDNDGARRFDPRVVQAFAETLPELRRIKRQIDVGQPIAPPAACLDC